MNMLIAFVAAAGIPSAVCSFCFWILEHKIQKREEKLKEERRQEKKEQDKREEVREKNELYILKSVGAAIALGEATARAVQRIPDAKCNGDMHAALEYAQRVKHEQKDFLNEQAIKAVF